MKALLSFVLLSAIASGAHARPFKEVCDQFEPLRRLSDLKYVKPVIRVQPESKTVKPQDVVFTVESRSGVIKVVPAADGAIDFPFSEALCNENPNLEVNQPKGSLGMAISIDPAIPPVRTLDYRLLESLRREWDTAISRQNLFYRMLAPSAKAYVVVFEPGTGGTVEIRLPQGARRLLADANGVVRIPFDDAWTGANPSIVLSDLPKRIGLAFKS
jgi:hypothetical protein